MERLRIDDPVGAFPVHGLNGIFGVLAVGIWGMDGVGLLTGGGLTQLGIQAIGVVACIAWTLPLSFLMFYLIQRFVGLRVSPEVEAAGIDLAYHGVESYPEFDAVELRGIQVRDWDAPLTPRGGTLPQAGD
jgi:Amt family ammonium transporter